VKSSCAKGVAAVFINKNFDATGGMIKEKVVYGQFSVILVVLNYSWVTKAG